MNIGCRESPRYRMHVVLSNGALFHSVVAARIFLNDKYPKRWEG
jgi:hypothetical protein